MSTKDMTRLTAKFAFLFVFLAASPAFAQLGAAPMPEASAKKKGPTLEETQSWITNKFREVGAFKFEDKNTVRYDASFDGCSFTLLQLNSLSRSSVIHGRLSDLNTTLGGSYIVDTIGGEKKFKYYKTRYDRRIDQSTMQLGLAGDPATLHALHAWVISYGYFDEHGSELNADGSLGFRGIEILGIDPSVTLRLGDAYIHAGNLCRMRDAEQRQIDAAKSAKSPTKRSRRKL